MAIIKTDYKDMAQSMIIGNPPSYEELILILGDIEQNLKPKFKQ